MAGGPSSQLCDESPAETFALLPTRWAVTTSAWTPQAFPFLLRTVAVTAVRLPGARPASACCAQRRAGRPAPNLRVRLSRFGWRAWTSGGHSRHARTARAGSAASRATRLERERSGLPPDDCFSIKPPVGGSPADRRRCRTGLGGGLASAARSTRRSAACWWIGHETRRPVSRCLLASAAGFASLGIRFGGAATRRTSDAMGLGTSKRDDRIKVCICESPDGAV
jgi:hypothetical protein